MVLHLTKSLSNVSRTLLFNNNQSGLLNKCFIFTSNRRIKNSSKIKQNEEIYTIEHLLDANNGAIKIISPRAKFGNFKIAIMLLVSILIGAGLASKVTKMLEENNLYSHGDADDLDDED